MAAKTPADQVPPDLATLARRIQALEREVTELRAAKRLESASVGAGGLRIVAGGRLAMDRPDGTRMLDIGAMTNPIYNRGDGSPQQAAFLRRDDGSTALSLYAYPQGSGSTQFLVIRDASSNIIVGDDAGSGQGLARPYLPLALSPAIGTGWDYWPRTTSATMADLWVGQIYKQQPRVVVVAVAACDTAGTTGQIQLSVNGTAAGAAQAVTTAGQVYTFGPFSLAAYDHMQQVTLAVTGRRTAGTGTVRAGFYSGYTIQS
ncbi:hypothetical protein ACIOC1_00445 [Streptomyces sp. NPDC088197]|uniref:hypothetical protein n=1 Tax=Streptomyces sp. NPDC088197 TaxID=3365840 RepID=UPI0037FAA775